MTPGHSRTNELRALLVALLLGASPAATDTPEVVERWKCDEVNSDYVVELVVFAGRTTGRITAPGVTHETDFEVDGLSKEWFWELDEGWFSSHYRFNFEIRSGSAGLFFDFCARR